MKKFLICCALVALTAAWGQPEPARRAVHHRRRRPAATLLLPYFEVDIADPNGVDTFFSINNAEPFSVLAPRRSSGRTCRSRRSTSTST